MKKRVDCTEITAGMYVSDLDRPWLETPFLFQGFAITSEAEIEELQRYCQYVYIDVEQSSPDAVAKLRKLPAGTEDEEQPAAKLKSRPSIRIQKEDVEHKAEDARRLEFEILRKNAKPHPSQLYSDITTLEQELEKVAETFRYARDLVPTIMEDVRMGRAFKTDGVKRVVNEMAASVIRNPDALVCLSQLKHKDAYTAEHSLRVSILALAFARHVGFGPEQMQLLGIGAMMHDMGKMRIPNEILNKPGELTQEEAQLMEQHVPFGVQILEATDIPGASIEVAAGHHERYDGTGYKQGAKGDAIGQFALIGGIVDFYDALTSDRAYRAGISPNLVLQDMYRSRGKLFHPELVEQFIQCMGVYPIGSVVETNTGEVGVVMTLNRTRRLKPRVAMVLQADNTPYPQVKYVDMVKDRTPSGGGYEITTVVNPDKYGIVPSHYLPLNHAR